MKSLNETETPILSVMCSLLLPTATFYIFIVPYEGTSALSDEINGMKLVVME